MKTVRFPNGSTVPALGQGTWQMAESSNKRKDEIAALQAGIDLGLTLIDTAEMYADGASEELVGEAIKGSRSKVFLVSKVYPHNASRQGVQSACERSLKRMGAEYIDLYLLHWPGSHPIAETVAGFEELKSAGKIAAWGVSNFDVKEMEGLMVAAGGTACTTNQILYNLAQRGPEAALLPWLDRYNIPVMAYSPLDRGHLATSALDKVAKRHNATVAQVALAFVLAKPEAIAIPKAASVAHVQQNAKAAEIVLGTDDLREIDAAFPPPKRKQPLAVY